MKEIMTPEHPKWDEFCDRLEGKEGCNFKENKNGKTTWKCKGENDKTFAKKLIKNFKGIDVEGSLRYFDEHGGHCDCEILFNVDPRDDE